jgi:hypothetical protein
MSWQIFKDNILRVSNNPDAINNIEIVADAYAKEYDAAIKRGFDAFHKTKVRSGDVEGMKQLFISALQKGLTSNQPYDLVGEMGEGVKIYWSTAILGNDVIPTILPPVPNAIQNIAVNDNRATNVGVWQKPLLSVESNFDLTPQERIQYQENLEGAITKRDNALENNKQDIADTYTDLINHLEGALEENTKYTIPLKNTPLEPQTVEKSTNNTQTNTTQTSTQTNVSTQTTTVNSSDIPDEDAPVKNIDDVIEAGTFNTGKPFVSGFKAGAGFGGGFGGGGGPYGPPTFPPNATLGQRVLAIALRDATVTPPAPVAENPKFSNWGHPRIVEILANCGLTSPAHWCACTVSTWWDEAGAGIKATKNPNKFGDGPNGDYRRSWVPDWFAWAGANGRLIDLRNGGHESVNPQPGWAVIYHWPGKTVPFNHIGIFWKKEGNKWFGVDGNGADNYLRTHEIKTSCVAGLVIC